MTYRPSDARPSRRALPVEPPPTGPRGRRRWRIVPWLVTGVLLAAAGMGAVVVLGGDGDAASGPEVADPALVGQVQTFEVPSRNHTESPVDYPQTPPVGGDHHPVWQDCGFYAEPVLNETAVHSMEHGAVWITFRPDLPDDQVDQIRALAQQDFVLASQWDDGDLPAPIVLSAWGVQLWLEALPDPAADYFIAAQRQGPGAPEPGAPCTGGYPEPR